MWHQSGVRGMHRKLRSKGRVPGAEGRAKIEENRAQRRQAKMAALSSVTEEETGRVERLRQEWLDKQKRLVSPVSERRTGITGSMCYPY